MTARTKTRSRYLRSRDLPRLLGLWPDETANLGEAQLQQIVARLAKSLHAESRRGRSRHWSYDLNRHWALAEAHAAEQATLRRMQRQRLLLQARQDPAMARSAIRSTDHETVI